MPLTTPTMRLIKNNGAALPVRPTLNFVPPAVATDNPGTNATDVTVSGSTGGASKSFGFFIG